MEVKRKHYWKGLEQLSNDPEFVQFKDQEFPGLKTEAPAGDSRRDFLKTMGFSMAAATLAACEAPVRKAIPYVVKPESVDPSVANYYASTFQLGGDYASIVVKTREGRPIKIEGNKSSKLTGGKVNMQAEASLLSLYDKERLTGPRKEKATASFEEIDQEIISQLSKISGAGGQIAIVTNSILSPSTKRVIADFKAKYPSTKHITYDADSASGIIKANQQSFGVAGVPTYNFTKANVIVSFAADFLGTWISPTIFSKQYAVNRKLGKTKKTMSKHYQFESNMSLAGANADTRFPVNLAGSKAALLALYNGIAAKAGTSKVSGGSSEGIPGFAQMVNSLWSNRGSSLVVSGSNDINEQVVVNAINALLGNYGSTIDLNRTVNYRQGNDAAMNQFVKDLSAGRVKAAIFMDSNPVYNHPKGAEIAESLSKASLTVATTDRFDETSDLVKYVAPQHHYLESWDDAEPVRGTYSFTQPTITPLFNTRQSAESLLKWSGSSTSYYDYLRSNWSSLGQAGWDKALYNGVLHLGLKEEDIKEFTFAGLGNAAQGLAKGVGSGLDVVLYTKPAIGVGLQANNPWLHEMPDPITKATWDNYFTISQKMAGEMGFKMVDSYTHLATLSVNGKEMTLPVLIQPGQADGTVGVALGYGRTKAGKVADGVGQNAFPMVDSSGSTSSYVISGGSLASTGESYQIARTQTHETYMGRDIVIQEATLNEYQADAQAGRYFPKIATSEGFVAPEDISLWKGWEYPNHHWGLVVDLNSCTGCGICTVACQVENNVPVVGKQEVLNRREMHWIRIDRYYSSDAAPGNYSEMEIASANPEVTFQPMMCQHCNNAPCETVCPVAATTHSSEGLNQMTYNRCIGTRYCANNCPYKVRRFNWFKYHDNEAFPKNTAMNNDLGKMVLNPDVTVRARGVMEKCSFCVQRIQAGKLTAKRDGRKMQDGDVEVACATACPTDALTFGDMNDPNSAVSKLVADEANARAYHVLEEINVKPNVAYLTKIRNKEIEA